MDMRPGWGRRNGTTNDGCLNVQRSSRSFRLGLTQHHHVNQIRETTLHTFRKSQEISDAESQLLEHQVPAFKPAHKKSSR